MTDTFARMKQLIGSTAEWASHDIVLGYGEIGIERVSATEYKAKVGDGTAKWSALPYLSAVAAGLNATVQAALDAKLPIAGGTMRGDLILAHDGAKPNEAVTYTQLQNEVSRITTALQAKFDKAGGTLTGPLVLAADATQPKEPVTFDQMTKAIAAGGGGTAAGGITYAGSIDPTKAFATPIPAPASGSMYTAAAAGALDPSWTSHIAGTPPATVAVGDQFVWSTVDSKFHYQAATGGGSAFIPLAGSAAVTGAIAWLPGPGGSLKGSVLLDGKGGMLDQFVVDEGTY